MNKSDFIRLSGWSLMLGAVVFTISMLIGSFQHSNWYVMIALVSLMAMPLLAFGFLGLRRKYGDQVGGFGKNTLLIGAILGPSISIFGYFGEIGLLGKGYDDLFVYLMFFGPAVLFICLVLFGVVALYKKPLPRWNVLPILAGLLYPIMISSYMITFMATGEETDSLRAVDVILLTMQFIALVTLGYILKSDVMGDTAVPA